jgi:hypothetical protein
MAGGIRNSELGIGRVHQICFCCAVEWLRSRTGDVLIYVFVLHPLRLLSTVYVGLTENGGVLDAHPLVLFEL